MAQGQHARQVGVPRRLPAHLEMLISWRDMAGNVSPVLSWSPHRGDHGCCDAGKGRLARLLETGLDDDLLARGAAGRQRRGPR